MRRRSLAGPALAAANEHDAGHSPRSRMSIMTSCAETTRPDWRVRSAASSTYRLSSSGAGRRVIGRDTAGAFLLAGAFVAPPRLGFAVACTPMSAGRSLSCGSAALGSGTGVTAAALSRAARALESRCCFMNTSVTASCIYEGVAPQRRDCQALRHHGVSVARRRDIRAPRISNTLKLRQHDIAAPRPSGVMKLWRLTVTAL